MKEFLKSKEFGSIELNEAKKIRNMVTKRWNDMGFLEGLKGYVAENCAQLYENEAKYLLQEATNTDSSGSFETVVFPLIRRTFGKLLANDIVSVQALNLSVGRIFYLLPITSKRREVENTETGEKTQNHYDLMGYNRKSKSEEGKTEPRFYLPDSVVNSPNDGTNIVEFYKKTLYDLFYNDGELGGNNTVYDNSKGRRHAHIATSVTYVNINGDGTITDIPASAVTRDLDGTVRKAYLKVSGFTQVNKGRLIGPDGNEMDTEEFLASLAVRLTAPIPGGVSTTGETAAFGTGDTIVMNLAAQAYGHGIVDYTNICTPGGDIILVIDLTKPSLTKAYNGYVGVDSDAFNAVSFVAAWCTYDSLELETEIGEVSFTIKSTTIDTTERKLRATWSPELAQDVSAFHNIDAEAELTALLSEQIGAEIDREILRDLRKIGPWTLRWDWTGWRRMTTTSTNYTQKDWNQTLITAINQISAQIQKATLKGRANYIVVSSEIGAIFDDLEYFHVTDASSDQDVYNMGIERIGSLSGRFQVYVDPYSPAWSIIIGRKGKSLLDTGYIYAPYVPLAISPLMYNPSNAAPVKYIMTRYGKKSIFNRMYGSIYVDNLQTFNMNEIR